jgi:glucosamine-6-phosphate deaminase
MFKMANEVRWEIVDNPLTGAELVDDYFTDGVEDPAVHNVLTSTGNTFKPIYAGLRRHLEAGYLSGLNIINQDEYCVEVGDAKFQMIAEDDPQSFKRFMRRELFDEIGFPLERSYFPGLENIVDEGSFDRKISQLGGIDVAYLGIGSNGHLGFNEPWSSFNSLTRLVQLTPETQAANYDPAIGKPVPGAAITVGLGTIVAAKEIVLVAFGEHKAEALYRAMKDEITEKVPASILQMPQYALKTLVVADDAAARLFEV